MSTVTIADNRRYRYVVLGAGRQGLALAFDLVCRGEAAAVTLVDTDRAAAERAIVRLHALVPGTACQLMAVGCDVSGADQVVPLLRGADVALSAVPYRFNEDLTDAAIAAGVSLCDLGGNTAIVRAQLRRHAAAAAAGVSVVPDCGLAPGLGNILAAHGIAALEEVDDVYVRCGGLPERPVGPLGYKLVFNFDGLLNEYSGCGEFLRGGEFCQVPALTELEELEFPPPLGRCEAAVTSGGTSTCAESFAGRVRNFDYKTVRYPGHFAIVRALFELGAFGTEAVALPDGARVVPRVVLLALCERVLAFPDVPDLVVLRCIVRGRRAGRPVVRVYDLLDRHDPVTGFSAMERTTAFPAALVAHLQARRMIAPGVRPLELALPLAAYWEELPGHDLRIALREAESGAGMGGC